MAGKLYLGDKQITPVIIINEGDTSSGKKYGIPIDLFVGDIDESGTLQSPSFEGDIIMEGVTSIGMNALSALCMNLSSTSSFNFTVKDVESVTTNSFFNTFAFYTGIQDVTFSDLLRAGDSSFRNAFYTSTITSLEFPKLSYITDQSTFQEMCLNSVSLTKAHFPELTNAEISSFQSTFKGCTLLKDVDLSKVITAAGKSFYQTFYDCKVLEEVEFTSLVSIDSQAFQGTFAGCTKLKKVSFPALQTIASNAFYDLNTNESLCFFNCLQSDLEIHFPAAMQARIESTSGYSRKWGATNATILFDL